MKNSTIEKLIDFVNQRPGLDFANYGDSKSYNSESREITKDRNDFYELLALALYCNDLDRNLKQLLEQSNDRLTLKNGNLEYCAGQYFPTEYRPAACRALVSIIWNSLRTEKDSKGEFIYKDGHEIRKAAKRNLSRRTANNYFN